jgi:hypothetical protein
MNASVTSSFFTKFNQVIKIAGSISMIVLALACFLIVGIALGQIQPSGSTAEEVVKFLWNTPWATLVLVALAVYAMILFWIKK